MAGKAIGRRAGDALAIGRHPRIRFLTRARN